LLMHFVIGSILFHLCDIDQKLIDDIIVFISHHLQSELEI
jgi:hypothetical protein